MANRFSLKIHHVSALAPILLCGRAFAQCSGYSVDILTGPVCQFESSSAGVNGINANGELCGGYYTCDKSADAAVWLGAGPWIPLRTFPPGFLGFNPSDINSSRQMSGFTASAEDPGLPLAAVYDFELQTMVPLGALPGHDWAAGYAINDGGVVVGASNNSSTGPLTAFVWQNDKMSALPLPFVGFSSQASDISNSTLICGWMATNPPSEPEGAEHAFIHNLVTGETTDIGVLLSGAAGSFATGINDAGAICGFSAVPCGQFCVQRKGFMWSNGVALGLGVLPGKFNSRPNAINNSGIVVGYCDPGGFEAFVWKAGIMTALNDLIPQDADLDVQIAWDVNDFGQIAAEAIRPGPNGTDTVALRLTPIPSPIGDSDCDGDIDVDDLLCVINLWADASPKGSNALPQGDFSHDGVVNVNDLMIVIDNWTF